MKQWLAIVFLSPVICLLFSSCYSATARQKYLNIDDIRFMPFPEIVYRDGVSSIVLQYCVDSGTERSLGVWSSYVMNNGKKNLQSLTIWTNGKRRAVQSEADLLEIRAVLTAACKSAAFQYYDMARYRMLVDLHKYHVIRREDALLEGAVDSDVLSDRLKAEKDLVSDFSRFHRSKYHGCNSQNISLVAHEILELLEGVTVEEIVKMELDSGGVVAGGSFRPSSFECQQPLGTGNGGDDGSD